MHAVVGVEVKSPEAGVAGLHLLQGRCGRIDVFLLLAASVAPGVFRIRVTRIHVMVFMAHLESPG